jgi:hypothetical protein
MSASSDASAEPAPAHASIATEASTRALARAFVRGIARAIAHATARASARITHAFARCTPARPPCERRAALTCATALLAGWLALFAAGSIALADPQSQPGAKPASSSVSSKSATRRFDLIDNGSFAEIDVDALDELGAHPIPWWRSARGMQQVIATKDGAHELVTKEGGWAEQPIAAYAPLARSIEIRGSVAGRGRVLWIDGSGKSAAFDVGADGDSATAFTLRADDAAKQIGGDLVPRFIVRLECALDSSSASDARGARWRDIHAIVELPCPSEAELRAEILALAKKIVTPWLERALDDEGPRKTAFVCHYFDALTGERLASGKGAFHPLYESLSEGVRAADVPEWRAALERFLEDFLTLGLAPATGLPCLWDPVNDAQVLDQPIEIGLPWGFLIDVADRGPEKFRERAKLAAKKIGDTVLAHGLLPDGNIGASFYPGDARVNPNVVQLRRLDVLAQLARLSALANDERYLRVAAEALSTFEYTNYWGGGWSAIDPAFDDNFGHYGARAATIALARPDDKLFHRFAIDGFLHFAPMWRDALRLGGNVAADQVRCWDIVGNVVRIEPSLASRAPRASDLLSMAARSHFKGEQYGDGSWGDLTIFDFAPKEVAVGDYPGAPQNLLSGLASIYGDDAGLPREELRAMYTAVLRSSVEHYLKPYGFIVERTERRGANVAIGTLRMLPGLTRMLGKLAP